MTKKELELLDESFDADAAYRVAKEKSIQVGKKCEDYKRLIEDLNAHNYRVGGQNESLGMYENWLRNAELELEDVWRERIAALDKLNLAKENIRKYVNKSTPA